MDKNCINCKWYYKQTCNCRNVSFTCDNNIEDQVIDFIEEGTLIEGIKETLEFKELTSIYLNSLREAGAIKKNINSKLINSNIEESEVNIIEVVDSCISSLLLSHFKNIKSKSNIIINNPNEFCCCNWE